ncbi:MAG: pitrilysin family protein, partial [Desulfococcus multivorans]|nr:pitrilysin family protein [Desulfococcus multivorans]
MDSQTSGCPGPASAFSSPQALSAIFHPSRPFAHETSDLAPDPDARFRELQNGFRYVLMPNHRPENRVSIHLYVQAGSMHERENERGLAHFLEHMLFNGSENFPPGELVKYFQRIGMRFGPDANAHTGFYSTVYDIDLPAGDPNSLAEALTVMKDYAAGALILETEVDRERPVILAEKRTRDSADYRTFEAVFDFELPEALLSRRLPIGTEEVITAADRNLLKSFYDAWYRPERMVLVMAGDFDLAAAEPLIGKTFSGLTARAPLREYPDPGVIHHHGNKAFYHHEPEAGGASVCIETITGEIAPPDSTDLKRKRLHESMANHILNQRLAEMLQDPETPFTSARITSGHYLNYARGADISAECPPENWEQTLAAIEQVLRRGLTHGFSASEVDLAKKNFLAHLDKAVKTAATRESRDLSRQILHGIGARQVFRSPDQENVLKSPMIAAATPADLHAALGNAWDTGTRLILVTGSAELRELEIAPERR